MQRFHHVESSCLVATYKFGNSNCDIWCIHVVVVPGHIYLSISLYDKDREDIALMQHNEAQTLCIVTVVDDLSVL